ncbi:MAG: hypothetical protein ACI8WB_000168 [Phenylobacterium sp.]|jgi:hypothetical protein
MKSNIVTENTFFTSVCDMLFCKRKIAKHSADNLQHTGPRNLPQSSLEKPINAIRNLKPFRTNMLRSEYPSEWAPNPFYISQLPTTRKIHEFDELVRTVRSGCGISTKVQQGMKKTLALYPVLFKA